MLSNCLANRKDCLLYLNMFINHAFQTPSAHEGPQQVEVQRRMTLGGSLSQEIEQSRLALRIVQGGQGEGKGGRVLT